MIARTLVFKDDYSDGETLVTFTSPAPQCRRGDEILELEAVVTSNLTRIDVEKLIDFLQDVLDDDDDGVMEANPSDDWDPYFGEDDVPDEVDPLDSDEKVSVDDPEDVSW